MVFILYQICGGGEIRTRVPLKGAQGFRDLAVKPLLHPTLYYVRPPRIELGPKPSQGSTLSVKLRAQLLSLTDLLSLKPQIVDLRYGTQ